jgi:predicted RNase H-like HicB family nuclease
MNTRYDVLAARSGRWWAIEVPELPGVLSQARRLDQVEATARRVIALTLHVSQDSFDVAITPDLDSLGSLKASIEEALTARQAAEVAQDRATAALWHAVAELRRSGYSSRDTGKLLGLSNQRISQIERQSADRPT